MKSRHNYVDNEKLSKELLEWVDLYHSRVNAGLPKPRVSEYIGSCILLIATNLTKLPKFNRYTWAEDMIGDAIENTLKYLHNFNANIETRTGKPNAFSWMSLSMERVFFDRIEREKRQIYYKNRLTSDSMLHSDELKEHQTVESGIANQIVTDMYNKAEEYEENQRKRKEKDRLKHKEEKKLMQSTNSLDELF